MIDGMAVWNEESMANSDMVFAGTTTATASIGGAMLFVNRDQWPCAMGSTINPSAKAFTVGSNCGTDAIVYMIMQDSCGMTAGTPRQWKTGWPGPTFDPWGLTGAMSYEFVAVHELGHLQGLGDYFLGAVGQGVMIPSGWHSAYLNLYPNDRVGLQASEGQTLRQAFTSWSISGSSWSTLATIGAGATSYAPALDGNRPAGQTLRAVNNQASGVALTLEGTHASWSVLPTADPPTDRQWMSIANTKWGETLVVWPDDCVVAASACDVSWAWTNNNGITWTRGTLTAADTFSKAFVEYDASGDRFVLAYIDSSNSRISLQSAPAISAPVWASAGYTLPVQARYLGGMVFDSSGNGLLVAASNWSSSKGRIYQMDVTSSGPTYQLSNARWLTSPNSLAHTRRPFSIAYDAGPDVVMVAWRDTGAPRSMAQCTKNGTSSSTYCSSLSFPISNVVNSVELAYDPPNNRFVAGVTQ